MIPNAYWMCFIRSFVYGAIMMMTNSCADPPDGIRYMTLNKRGLIVIASPGLQCNIDYTCGKLSKLINMKSIGSSDIGNVIQVIYDRSDQVDEVKFEFTVLSSESLVDGEYIVEVFGYSLNETTTQRKMERLIDSARFTILNGSLVETHE